MNPPLNPPLNPLLSPILFPSHSSSSHHNCPSTGRAFYHFTCHHPTNRHTLYPVPSTFSPFPFSARASHCFLYRYTYPYTRSVDMPYIYIPSERTERQTTGLLDRRIDDESAEVLLNSLMSQSKPSCSSRGVKGEKGKKHGTGEGEEEWEDMEDCVREWTEIAKSFCGGSSSS